MIVANGIVRDVHLPDGSGPVDLKVTDGRIAALDPPGSGTAEGWVVEGAGGTIVPGLLDAHCHLDQSLMGAPWTPIPPSTEFIEKIQAAERVVLGMTEPSLVDRAEALCRSMVALGTLAARSHASITPAVGLRGVEALVEARRRLAGLLTLQVVAFPQFGTRDPAVPRLLAEAIRLGADVVGGMDPASVDRDVEASLQVTFKLALEHDLPIDIHVHDPGTLGLFQLERICDWTERHALAGRVAASHGLALGELRPPEVAATLDRLAAAGVAVISTANPNAAMPRVEELDARGVRLGLGSDAAHTSAPFGTSDMFKKANLLAQRQTFVADAQLVATLERVTATNAAILGLPTSRIAVGEAASFVVVESRNPAEVIATPPKRRTVVVGGLIAAPPEAW